MASKKNLPNIPIYIGDWERDCNVLSLETEAAWMRIIFKMFTKGKQSSYKIPTKALQNLWRCGEDKMNEILDELTFNEICPIVRDDSGWIIFTSRRFQKENEISKARSNAVSSRRDRKKTDSKILQNTYKTYTKHIQTPENENENDYDYDIEIVNENENENEKKSFVENLKIEIYPTFEDFWSDYDKKIGNKEKIKKKWDALSQKIKEEIIRYIPDYKASQPDKRFRKNPETFINNKSWEDEILQEQIISNGTTAKTNEQIFRTAVESHAGRNFEFK
jgi:uncharacterized protein YdaU (DUF1376 family)